MPIFYAYTHFLNTFRKLILKFISLLLKNTFKSSKIQKKFSEKDSAHKVYELLYNSRGRSRTLATSKRKKHCYGSILIHTVFYNCCSIWFLYCFSVWYYAIPKTLLFLIWIYFLYNISSKWIGTSTRTIFETSDVALISALETMLLKNAFMYEKFLNSNTVTSTGIFLINFFSTQMVAYFSTRRKIFCISSLMAYRPPRFRRETNFCFRNVSLFVSLHAEVKSYFFNF